MALIIIYMLYEADANLHNSKLSKLPPLRCSTGFNPTHWVSVRAVASSTSHHEEYAKSLVKFGFVTDGPGKEMDATESGIAPVNDPQKSEELKADLMSPDDAFTNPEGAAKVDPSNEEPEKSLGRASVSSKQAKATTAENAKPSSETSNIVGTIQGENVVKKD